MRLPLLAALLFTTSRLAADPIPLWPNGAPGALGTKPEDIPTLTAYLPPPEIATGAAMVICPGGGYVHLADHEGRAYAEWLAKQGVAGLVLTYRLASNGYHHPSMLQDATRAMRLARSKAAEWKIDPKRVGIMGSSAGGHLASTLLTHYDAGKADDPDPVERESSRPTVGILCYAVISMGVATHGGSRDSLLGEHPAPELIEFLSNEKQVTKDTPPCFIFHTWEDKTVRVENALAFAMALREHGVLFDLHIYEHGGHGMGLGKDEDGGLHPWTRDCSFWLKEHGFIK